MKHVTYTVVIERGQDGFGAYVPDLPGCVAVGESEAEVMELIRAAIEFHIEGLRRDGEPVPQPTTRIAAVKVNVAA